MFVLLRQTNPQRKSATSHCLGIGLQTQRVLVQTLIKPTVWKRGSTSNEDDLKRKLFLKFENFVLLDALGSAWLQKSIFLKKIILGWRGSLIRPLMKEMTAGFLVTSKKVWVIILLMEGI